MNILIRTQKALKLYLDAVATAGGYSLTVRRALTNETAISNLTRTERITLPMAVCHCNSAIRDDSIRGNWSADALIVLRFQANETTEDVVETWCDRMSAALEIDDLTPAINTAAASLSYTVLGATIQRAAYQRDGNVWEISISMRLYCCASDIS
jgi:hypothetical protein